MFKFISSSTVAVALLILGLAAPAYALSNRAWVSGHGTDAPGCATPAHPCSTFQYVHDNIIAPGGEIDVLDPAGYGPVTIAKALSIVNDGAGTAGLQPGGNFVSGVITINAGWNDAITLRGLTIDGFGFSSGSGVLLNSGGRLTIDNCFVFNFNNTGINIAPRLATPVNVFVAILNTIVAESVGNPAYGIELLPTLMANVTAEISHTTAVGIGAAGIWLAASGFAAAHVSATIVDSVSAMNGFGVQVRSANAVVRIGHSVLTANRIGVLNDGTALSYGDNEIDGNGTNVGNTPLILIPIH